MDPMPTDMLDTAFWLTTAAILVLLGISAVFSGSEAALTAASRSKLKAQADKGLVVSSSEAVAHVLAGGKK